jgi:hypothetical protein
MARWPNINQKRVTFGRIGYHPFAEQWPIHQSSATVLQVVGAEGGGKSQVAAAEITACVPWCKLIYLIGQTYENTHPEFNYLFENLSKLGAVAKVNQPRMGSWEMSTRTGCRIVTLSVERGASAIIAKGEQPDIITITEAGIVQSYGVALAATRRATRARGRVILVGTLKDNFGWYASLVDELQTPNNAWLGETYSLPAWCNTALYPGGRDDPEIKRLETILPPDEFARTVAAERVPSRALVFPEFSYRQHVRPCPFDPELSVTIWIDPGYFPSAYAVLPVQFHGPEVWIIDEIYLNHHTHEQVINIAKAKPWWGKVNRAVIDHAGRQHHAEKSAVEVWQANTGLRPRSQPVGVLDGISRHRGFLAAGRLYHDEGCKQTLAEYKLYKRPTDRDGNPTDDMPRDEHNHAMKAIAYGLVDQFGFTEKAKAKAIEENPFYA